MKVTELDKLINEGLEQEARKLIKEQADSYDPLNDPNYNASGIETSGSHDNSADKLIEKIKNFQSLSGLLNKVTETEDNSTDKPVVFIKVDNVTPEELIDACGGSSLGEALKNLMQGIHHDLEQFEFGNDLDVDIDTQGDENALHLAIKITGAENSLTEEIDMKESTKDTNPSVDKKKDVILGGKGVCPKCHKELCECGDEMWEIEVDEQAKEWVQKNFVKKEGDVTEDKKWIQKAVNPKHKGYCTPMTKSTCTPQRKALAKRFKKGIENNESTMKKPIITISESGMAQLLKKIIYEAAGKTMDATTAKSIKDSGDQNNAALRAVEKKIKDYLSFKGNDNPEFPNQIGMGDDKMARKNTEDQDQLVSDNRGRGPQDLDYDNSDPNTGEPPKKFKERMEMSLKGDPKMGNSQDALNVVKTDTGEKMLKNMKRRKENFKKEPIYPKEAVPVRTKTEKEMRPVNEDIEKMKHLLGYNEKTQ
jgi:hypothetical protein